MGKYKKNDFRKVETERKRIEKGSPNERRCSFENYGKDKVYGNLYGYYAENMVGLCHAFCVVFVEHVCIPVSFIIC